MPLTQSCDSLFRRGSLWPGIPIKIAIIEKNRKRAWDDGKREKTWFERSSFSFSPAPPQHKEASAEERDLVTREDPLLLEIKH